MTYDQLPFPGSNSLDLPNLSSISSSLSTDLSFDIYFPPKNDLSGIITGVTYQFMIYFRVPYTNLCAYTYTINLTFECIIYEDDLEFTQLASNYYGHGKSHYSQWDLGDDAKYKWYLTPWDT